MLKFYSFLVIGFGVCIGLAFMALASPVSSTQIHLEDFENVTELKAFLLEDNTDSMVYLKAGVNGVVKLNSQCEDRAFQLRDAAAEKGKRIETEALGRNEYWKWYGKYLGVNEFHMINKAFIGNEVYYIEPSNDKVWVGLRLD